MICSSDVEQTNTSTIIKYKTSKKYKKNHMHCKKKCIIKEQWRLVVFYKRGIEDMNASRKDNKSSGEKIRVGKSNRSRNMHHRVH